jgi:N-acetylglucosamine kinase-like BadF-type ATPase
MRFVLGFDGGGTKTACVLADETQNVRARSRSGPSNPLRVGFDAALAALREAAHRVTTEARVEPGAIAAICAGLAGTGRPEAAEQMRAALAAAFPSAAVKVCTDLELALAAAGEGPAIVLVAGTGSAAIGRDAQGQVVRAGGYGPLLGDEGSACDIGHRAVAAALRVRDRSGGDSALGLQILRQLGCASWTAVQERVHAAADEVFPRVFPVVAAAADAGDELARELLGDAARELAMLADTLVVRLGLRDAIFLLAKTGGVLGRSAILDVQLDARLREIAPLARIGPLPVDPAEAAARLALRLISTRDAAVNEHDR